MKIRPVGAELFHADRHMTEVVVAFRSVFSALNKGGRKVVTDVQKIHSTPLNSYTRTTGIFHALFLFCKSTNKSTITINL
jgi:hypothetical protein